jgi:carboxylesterase
MSHAVGATVGALVVHGFTGTPASVRIVGEAIAAAGYDVEVPRLPGHATSVDDLLTTDWSAWFGEVARVRAELERRCDHVVLVGQSMGGTLVLASALVHPPAGLVCINPLTRMRSADELALIDELLDDGLEVVPGGGSDIADPDGSDVSYSGTPLRPLRSLLHDGVAPIADRYGDIASPLRLFTSRQDHVVTPQDSVHLAATFGGAVEHLWLERSYHVATRDHDRQVVVDGTVDFMHRISTERNPR